MTLKLHIFQLYVKMSIKLIIFGRVNAIHIMKKKNKNKITR